MKMKHITRNTNRSHRSETKSRRAARVRIGLVLACALGFLLAGVAVFHEVVPWKPESDGVALAQVPPTHDPRTAYPEADDPTGGGLPPLGGTEIPASQMEWRLLGTTTVVHRKSPYCST